MIKDYSQLLVGFIVGLVAGLLIAKMVFVNNSPLRVAQDQSRQTETAKRSDNPSPSESGKLNAIC
jgi:predicted cobalt transporter CbtA